MLVLNIAMTRTVNLSFGAAAILHAVAAGQQFGFDIIEATGLTSGTVYPTLDRLESYGYLRSRWENEAAAHREGRPARRYFTLTASGAAALRVVLAKYKALRPLPGFAPEGAKS
jgi:PadR family transcriptional regulator PadR